MKIGWHDSEYLRAVTSSFLHESVTSYSALGRMENPEIRNPETEPQSGIRNRNRNPEQMNDSSWD